MPRSGRLTNIASGLSGAFASRNNDLDGYWTIGKLRSLADQHGQATVTIDLLALSMQPSSVAFAPVLTRYSRLLARLAGNSGVKLADISAASLMLDFAAPPRPSTALVGQDQGAPFILTVNLEADGGAAGIVRQAGECRPHDPARESRSSRGL